MNAGGTCFHFSTCVLLWKTFEDTKVVIRNRKLKKNRHYNDKKTKTKGQATIYKTLHRKLKIEQHEPH